MDNAVRKIILPGVQLTYVRTDKFKTSCLSMMMLCKLDAADAAKNAVIPEILRRGTVQHPDLRSISEYLDGLYGARIEPIVRRKGEVQCTGFIADFLDDAYVGDGKILERTAELMGELLHSPVTRSGMLLQDYVYGERSNLLDAIDSLKNDKRAYSLYRLQQLMCAGEAFAVSRYGTRETAEKLYPRTLTTYYKKLLKNIPIEVIYCGSAELERVTAAVGEALALLPRDEQTMNDIPETAVIRSASETRYFRENMDVAQAKLAIGYRSGAVGTDTGYPALLLMNAVFGGSATSRLFTNVREKLSLCYYASSSLDKHKGLMYVSSGIDKANYERVLTEVETQLDAVRRGDFTDEEFTAAKKYIVSALRGKADSLYELEDFWLGQSISGLEYSLEDMACAAAQVTREQLEEAAQAVSQDSVYLLCGKDGDSDE